MIYRLDVCDDLVVYRRISENELQVLSRVLQPDMCYEEFMLKHVPLINIEQTIIEKNQRAKSSLRARVKSLEKKINDIKSSIEQLDKQTDIQIDIMYEAQRVNRMIYERKHGPLDYPPIQREPVQDYQREPAQDYQREPAIPVAHGYPPEPAAAEHVAQVYPPAYVTIEDMNVKLEKPIKQPVEQPMEQPDANFFDTSNDPFDSSSFFEGNGFFGNEDSELVLTEKTEARQLLRRHNIETKKHWKLWSIKNHPDKNPSQQNIDLVAEINAAVSLLADEIV